MSSCIQTFGDTIEGFIVKCFHGVGSVVGHRPRQTIVLAILLAVLTGYGFTSWETENRSEKLWVPQDTLAEQETIQYETYFPQTTRFNQIIVQASDTEKNVLHKEQLMDAMEMHQAIADGITEVDGTTYSLVDLCVQAGGSCVSSMAGSCSCSMRSILKLWNYDMEQLENDDDYQTTLQGYGSMEDFQAVLGKPEFDANGTLVSAEALSISYFLKDQSILVDGSDVDEVGEAWEEEVFLHVASDFNDQSETLALDYLSGRSFNDEVGESISGDLVYVQVSYVLAFLYLGANLGKFKCGEGSRWTMALGALATVGLSTAAGFGLSSIFGMFYGPVHSVLPFILLGIGVDDSFVIVNAFNRERKGPRSSEDNEGIAQRCARALGRAGASITVTSATDLVAFAISSSSSLPALASFCGYASIAIFFLWAFASTFFTATMVLDERRQRDNRRECLCCLTRSNESFEKDTGFEEDMVSRYFLNYHAPALMSRVGKTVVLVLFAGLLGFGVFGATNLSVEDTSRAFIPQDSYLADYIEVVDELFPSGPELTFVFQGSKEIYEHRQELADLADRLSDHSERSPYIAEPVSERAYRNVMVGLHDYLEQYGTASIGNAALGQDGWPTNEEDFVMTLQQYASSTGPGAMYVRDVVYDNIETSTVSALRVVSEHVILTKEDRRGRIINDAKAQIDAMEDTRVMISSWTDLPPAFVYCSEYINIEGFKVIKKELFLNVGLAIASVALIVLLTVASPLTALLITWNVGCCIVEILGLMYISGIAIDATSVVVMVLSVGLSVDYSAHVGHCFMTKAGDRNTRTTEALADMGAAVLNGAISTFLAVAVLLFSSSYVFETLSKQFAFTVVLGALHGLVLLPVMLSLVGPEPFASSLAASDHHHHHHSEGGDVEKDPDATFFPSTKAGKLTSWLSPAAPGTGIFSLAKAMSHPLTTSCSSSSSSSNNAQEVVASTYAGAMSSAMILATALVGGGEGTGTSMIVLRLHEFFVGGDTVMLSSTDDDDDDNQQHSTWGGSKEGKQTNTGTSRDPTIPSSKFYFSRGNSLYKQTGKHHHHHSQSLGFEEEVDLPELLDLPFDGDGAEVGLDVLLTEVVLFPAVLEVEVALPELLDLLFEDEETGVDVAVLDDELDSFKLLFEVEVGLPELFDVLLDGDFALEVEDLELLFEEEADLPELSALFFEVDVAFPDRLDGLEVLPIELHPLLFVDFPDAFVETTLGTELEPQEEDLADFEDEQVGLPLGLTLGCHEGSLDDGTSDGSPDGAEDGTCEGIDEGCELGFREGAVEGSELGPELGAQDGLELGPEEGCRLGVLLGFDEGLVVGTDDGLDVGDSLGFGVGLDDGLDVGDSLGFGVGLEDGLGVGDSLGFGVGLDDGLVVGDSLGFGVGFDDGLDVGDSLGFGV
eukprot:Nitzschia sp. Nitz4//scaffold395_size11642//5914//11294//NITZ4_009033-RA/size11642-processed-gene-0.12-mRNA-1//-1//CDS//3329550258//1366//frame0